MEKIEIFVYGSYSEFLVGDFEDINLFLEKVNSKKQYYHEKPVKIKGFDIKNGWLFYNLNNNDTVFSANLTGDLKQTFDKYKKVFYVDLGLIPTEYF